MTFLRGLAAGSVGQRVWLALLGVALLVTGAVAVFESDNTTGTGVLIAAGLALVAISTYGDRLETVEAAGVKFQLAQAGSKIAAATEAAARGDLGLATKLRQEAAELLAASRTAASNYEAIRATESSSWGRTARLESLIRGEARVLLGLITSPDAVAELFRTGGEGNRVLAIAMMEENPRLVHVGSLVDAIQRSRSAFEQYHALKAAEAYAGLSPKPADLAQLRTPVEVALTALDPKGDRAKVARHVLALLPE